MCIRDRDEADGDEEKIDDHRFDEPERFKGAEETFAQLDLSRHILGGTGRLVDGGAKRRRPDGLGKLCLLYTSSSSEPQ